LESSNNNASMTVVSFINAWMACVSVWAKGIEERPGVLGWLIRTRLVHLEEVDDARNLSLRERTVGIYDETTKSEMHDPCWYAEPYIPAA
jgi:hypothetical protein